jgi:3-dehydroquinate dehydratase/shikimate dehydrogenase
VLVVGNGGAARAASFALVDAGARVSITGRNADRIRALAKCCGGEAVLTEQLPDAHYDILVHATPLGMWPHLDECFFDGPIPADVVFDLVYNPERTMLLKRASAQGCETIPGVEMFIEQAARQFEIFTGENAPRAVMQQAAREALAEQFNHSLSHG